MLRRRPGRGVGSGSARPAGCGRKGLQGPAAAAECRRQGAIENGDGAMILMIKKVGGLALVLLGGLLVAHGALVGPVWEILVGLLLVLAGMTLLAMKVAHRNWPSQAEL